MFKFIKGCRKFAQKNRVLRTKPSPVNRATEERLLELPSVLIKVEGHRSRADAWNQFAPWHGAIIPRSASPFAADVFRRARMDWSAMSEHSRVEAKRGDLALAASSFLDILKSYWIAEPHDVHANIACDQ